MFIERDAKRYIYRGIELQRELKSLEEPTKDGKFESIHKELVEIFCKINPVANVEGKGRDDLKVEILLEAEKVIKQKSSSKAIKKMATQIVESFNGFCDILSKYEKYVERVDPQLRNNKDLTEVLLEFENSWTKGKYFLLDKETSHLLMESSKVIEDLCNKYEDFKEKLESMDADLFLIVPCIIILNSLKQNHDEIFKFCEKTVTVELKEKLGNANDEVYKIVEENILDKNISKESLRKLKVTKSEIEEITKEVKEMAIVLQRNRPSDWNLFMEMAMDVL